MKKTYVTSMPNHIGAFLKASKCFSALGINITRVSYNKAVDSHTLFIDAEGTVEQLEQADTQLENIGYLPSGTNKTSVVLLEFRLEDVPGSVTNILTLINDFNINISYISSQENGTNYQYFKMGLFVEDPDKISAFMKEAQKLCKIRVIDYNRTEKVYDNSIFYSSYAAGLSKTMDLPEETTQKLLVHVNLAMQTLDEQGLSPYRTFDTISRFAELLGAAKGDAFNPRITRHKITENTCITTIEPPCGSNTTIIESNGKYLFVDSGYACYAEEMKKIFKQIIPDFDRIHKTILITHADVDHCGLLHMFDEILASHRSALCLENEYWGKGGFREHNPLHKPYINICQLLTSYQPTPPDRITALWKNIEDLQQPLTEIGTCDFEQLHFSVFEGKGGHLPGEVVLIDYKHRIVFTGDVYINIHGLTTEQAAYNQCAPILMTSVDTDPVLCAAQRKAVMQLLTPGQWQIFGAHGLKKDLTVD